MNKIYYASFFGTIYEFAKQIKDPGRAIYVLSDLSFGGIFETRCLSGVLSSVYSYGRDSILWKLSRERKKFEQQ